MPESIPTRSKVYLGPMTDTRIWRGFELRPDDVIIATPPKCGTTWMQTIVMMLILGRPALDHGFWTYSPWLDAGWRDQKATEKLLIAQSRRRCI